MSKITHCDVAKWMEEEVRKKRELYQEVAAWHIKNYFGDDFVYINVNGNLAIDKKVLAEFRKLTEKAVSLDTSPKVFIKTIKPQAKLDTNAIEIISSIIFTNCGKTEAKDIKWSYVINSEGQKKIERSTGPYQYLFPSQTISYNMENI